MISASHMKESASSSSLSDATPPPGAALQSIRSSCDRCRFHKLKCNVPAGHGGGPVPCERCTRAKVPCVFGRRRRANRPSEDKKRPAPARRVTMPSPSPTSASTSAHGGDSATGASSSGSDPPPSATDPALQRPASHSDAGPAATYDGRSWEALMTSGLGDNPDIMPGQQNSTGNGWEWFHQGFGLDDTSMFDAETLDPAIIWSPPTPQHIPTAALALATTELDMATTPPAISGSTASMMRSSSSSSCCWAPVQQLLPLIADMQQRLKILEQGPWQSGDFPQSLDDYPVGAILHLSQEFGSIAGQVLSRASAAGMVTAVPGRNHNHTADGGTKQALQQQLGSEGSNEAVGEDGGVDTATALLVLGGYMWLMRIYGVALGHFQVHLSGLSGAAESEGGGRGTSKSGPNASPALRLGELPSTGTAPDLGRIHTALGMLQGSLAEVEGQLGRGGAVVRNLVVALLTRQEAISRDVGVGVGGVGGGGGSSEHNGGGGSDGDDSEGLGGKVQAVKELLREKMGF